MKRVNVKATCPSCGKTQIISVDLQDLQMWQCGAALIQDAMPYLTPSEREMLMTGLCDDCFPKEDYDCEQSELSELDEEYEDWLDDLNSDPFDGRNNHA